MRKTLNEIEFFVRGENYKSSISVELLKTVNHPGSLKTCSKILDEITLKSSLASATVSTNGCKDVSYQQQELSKEIGCYLSDRCGSSSDEQSVAYLKRESFKE